MANTYTLIDSAIAGSGGSSSFNFTSIANTFTDLKIVASLRADSGNPFEFIVCKFNGSTTGYSARNIRGDGASATSGIPVATSYLELEITNGSTSTSNTFGSLEIYIPNYASSNYKSVSADTVMENNATTAYASLVAGLWSNTAAITSVSLSPLLGTVWLQYSTAYLYGISNS